MAEYVFEHAAEHVAEHVAEHGRACDRTCGRERGEIWNMDPNCGTWENIGQNMAGLGAIDAEHLAGHQTQHVTKQLGEYVVN
jgi:hypothetical protein